MSRKASKRKRHQIGVWARDTNLSGREKHIAMIVRAHWAFRVKRELRSAGNGDAWILVAAFADFMETSPIEFRQAWGELCEASCINSLLEE